MVSVCDIDSDKAVNVLRRYYDEEIITLYTPGMQLEKDAIIVTNDAKRLTELVNIDVIIEATGNPEVGALVSCFGIKNRKHIVMLSYETVVTIGNILAQLAQQAGVVFTGAAGDEPAAIMELFDFAKALGFKVVAAGKGKNNQFNRYATPDQVEEEARLLGTSKKIHCSFVDGSKTMVEMAAVANATGLVPDIRGMHGPTTSVDQLAHVFSTKKQGGILNKTGVVDFALGNIAPGVFVVITTDDPFIAEDLRFEKMGEGPNYLLFRPYHLCDIETPLSTLLAREYNEASLLPLEKPIAEVFAVAKRDLNEGEVLDGFGGETFYSLIDEYEVAKKERLLPAGIAKNCVVKTKIKKDTPITYSMVEVPRNNLLWTLRKLQDQFCG